MIELRRLALLTCVAVVTAGSVPPSLPAQQARVSDRPPNILLVVSDDQGWGDVRSHGNPYLDTPVLDRLASEGARFERFYVSPICAPTRAALLTGRYPIRTGTIIGTGGFETVPAEEVTVAEIFHAAGYATGVFGKWHNGQHYPTSPEGQGFDEFLGFMGGHWNDYFDPRLLHRGQPVQTEGYITDVLADATIRFMRQHRDRPFFAYVPFNTPHEPFQVPDKYYDKYRALGLDESTSAVYGMVENLDENVGRLLAALDELGLNEETIVLFMGDNGPNTDRYNAGMRGRKGSVYEGGVRVPLFVRWPGRIGQGRVVRRLGADIDLLPTLAELAGIPMIPTRPLDGISLESLLLRGPERWPERRHFSHRGRVNEQGVLPAYPGSVRTERYSAVRTGGQWELYDLQGDPGQARDLALEEPRLTAELAAAYDRWFEDVARAGVGPSAIPVGYPEAPIVSLPATHARITGEIHFATHPAGWTHDWLTGWVRAGDEAAWDIDVIRPGRYEVVLMHTAPLEGIGATVHIEAGASATAATIERAVPHEPGVRPSRDPGARRTLVKEFAELPAGTVQVTAGKVRLKVWVNRSVEAGAFDLSSVVLRRVGD